MLAWLCWRSRLSFLRGPEQKELRTKLIAWTQPLLLVGGTAMMVFSGYLMYLLTAEIQAACLYCIGSALLSTGLFLLALMGQDWSDRSQPLFIGIITAVVIFCRYPWGFTPTSTIPPLERELMHNPPLK